MSITRGLAEFVVKTRYEDLPPKVIYEAKRILLDSIGCGLGAHSIEKGFIAVQLAKELGGKPEASIIGSSERVTTANAAFANGELISGLDNDPTVAGHVPPFVIPPALALAERTNATGSELILAAIIGWEVGSRVLRSMPGQRSAVYPILQGTDRDRRSAVDFSWACTIIGAAASAGKALGLDVNQMEDAFGLAAHMCPVQGWASQSLSPPVGMHKFDLAGWIAQGGVLAALLAQKGYTGHKSVLDGEHGFWWFYGAVKCDLESMVRDLGTEWNTLIWSAKKFPVCGAMGASLGAFIEILMEEKIQPEDIEAISVKIDPLFNLPMWLSNDVRTCVDAQFSIAYPFAAAAYYPLPRGLGPIWQTPEVIQDHRVRRLMDKIQVGFHEMDRFPIAKYQGAQTGLVKVDVVARGRTYNREGQWKSQWHQNRAASQSELAEKFSVNASAVLPPEKIEDAVKILMELERIDSVSKLMNAICVS
jgi:2-methylcitrate dehydratase PrpD